ncbi:hypothetical protein ACFTXJ_00130 [Streptomyces zhihengii]|uniref:hypothetical protein n=1 Tax=Streptomyces zhihengii TaxID=1818004 RepID=UPI0036335801
MISRRNFIAAASLAVGTSLVPTAISRASDQTGSLLLTSYINGQRIDRTAVLEWEARRLKVAAARLDQYLPAALTAELGALLDGSAPSVETVARDREALADVKLQLGHDAIRDHFAADLAISGPMSVLAAATNQWSASTIQLTSTRGSAQGFMDWFNTRINHNDQRAMLLANPDHYLITSPRSGAQEVIEVTGGAMLASQFFIDYTDNTGVPTPRDPLYPVQTTGWARTSDGTKIGAVRHQLRDNAKGGFTAQLAVSFPAALPSWMFTEHQWHLACEFSNWVTAYIAATQP